MTPESIRIRLTGLALAGEPSIMDALPETEWWLVRHEGPCEACADTGEVPVLFGTTVFLTVPCPNGCVTGHPAD